MKVHEDEAEAAGLRYVSDHDPGFSRRRRGKSFQYFDWENNRVSNDSVLHRIRSLVLPPAWEDVWICRYSNGHLQATGRDARERKQYRYHAKWSAVRNETKFEKLALFGEILPELREKIEKHLRGTDMSRERVLAAVIKVMEETHIRIGNDEYAETNDSYGLTTIRNSHAKVSGAKVKFRFRGKSGVLHETSLIDQRLSKIIRKCQDLPGDELFAYETEDGKVVDVKSDDVNSFLKDLTGENITAKDFRTWAGSVEALKILHCAGDCGEISKRERRSRELRVIEGAAACLGNTTSVCRKYYIHPHVFEADREAGIARAFTRAKKNRAKNLSLDEKALLEILKR